MYFFCYMYITDIYDKCDMYEQCYIYEKIDMPIVQEENSKT